MAKIGISGKIDVSKIIKDHLYRGAKGTYLDVTMFVDLENRDQYDNNGMVTQSWKDQQKGEGPILGNVKVFWSDGQGNSKPASKKATYAKAPANDFDDEVPF